MRTLSTIAREIERVWVRKDGSSAVYFGARPYLDAMRQLDSVDDSYGWDTGESIVRYALSNMTTFRGDDARRLKAELKAML